MDKIVLLCLVSIGNVCTEHSTRQTEGYPAGFLANCPGTNKEAIITKKSLKYLSIVVQSGEGLTARHRKYNYYQTSELAKDPDLDFNRTTLLYVGGYLDSPSFFVARTIGLVYNSLGYNVLLLDTNMFTTMEYPRAARFMPTVGKHAAEMLADLTQVGLDPKKLELVGLSLGGQTASFIAKNYKLITGTKISRLTGLDPSGPCFRNLGPEERIDKGDADFVDIVATNIDGYGMATPAGHVNFYVNGGEYQPGEIFWVFCDVICSHVRALTVWISALKNQDSFIAIQCDSVQQARDKDCFDRKPKVTTVFGLKTDKSKEGIFYLSTDHKYPFYLGQRGVFKENDFTLSMTRLANREKVLKI
ncbi:unnamed protein product [Leptosia nina]|uniref:Lipase domain-containing protein n=1 Tax=Leptosia nina TaxID=320188 RepID=A0AAV1J6A8_9NEOP